MDNETRDYLIDESKRQAVMNLSIIYELIRDGVLTDEDKPKVTIKKSSKVNVKNSKDTACDNQACEYYKDGLCWHEKADNKLCNKQNDYPYFKLVKKYDV